MTRQYQADVITFKNKSVLQKKKVKTKPDVIAPSCERKCEHEHFLLRYENTLKKKTHNRMLKSHGLCRTQHLSCELWDRKLILTHTTSH